jgi:3-deoxy-7-phosphoheptulonate synthase
MGVPIATEMLDPTTPAYLADLVSWTAIGARTTESQTHREMASSLPMPVGFKNSTDGSLSAAINAIRAAGAPQSFPGIDQNGRTSVVRTCGNPRGHIVLRGGGKRTNYDAGSIEEARNQLKEKGLSEIIMVDCSHDNSGKDHRRQGTVWNNVVSQRLAGDESLMGLMLESQLHEGKQPFSSDASGLKYGVSVTDACISWQETEELLLYADEDLKNAV